MQSTPVEVDTKLAELHEAGHKLDTQRASQLRTIKDMAGARYYYRGRQRVTDMTEGQAIEKLSADPSKRDLRYGRTHAEALAQLDAIDTEIAASDEAIRIQQAKYTGWSRFFVVTSSNGHIHSSTHCGTCRPTTTYGWLPELSGKDMTSAIEHFGPAAECLCSVCFTDAPVARDQNLTQAQTDALLRGETPQAKPVSDSCPGSGQQAQDADFSYYQPRGRCPHCKASITPTSTGKVRKHKAAK